MAGLYIAVVHPVPYHTEPAAYPTCISYKTRSYAAETALIEQEEIKEIKGQPVLHKKGVWNPRNSVRSRP